ncbi:sulfatase [Pirellulaceae bacterium SH501]
MVRLRHLACILLVANTFYLLGFHAYAQESTQVLVESRPNIVVMLIDDMGVMDTSVPFLTDRGGSPVKHPLNEFYRTPQMERLAKQGIRFNQFCAMSVCSPTRISILTGQNAARHRTTNWIQWKNNNGGPRAPKDWNWLGLGATDVTLPRLLQSQGYRTIHVGKGHLAPRVGSGSNPLQLGFDINVGGESIGQPASYYGTKNFSGAGDRSDTAVPGLEAYHGRDVFLTEALTLEANRHITEAVESNKPFFLYLPHYAVHAPFNPDPRFADHYRDSRKPPQAQAFATLVEGVDRSLGMVLDRLEALGVAENTLVLFLGDNGTDAPLGGPHEVACAAPLRGKKGSHYEGGMRVPFIASWGKPDANHPSQKRLPIKANAIQQQIANVTDLFPTLLELAQSPVPKEHVVDGQSLATLFQGQADGSRRESFLMHYPHSPHRSDYWSSLREGEWKVIYHYFPSDPSGGSHYQLFHLANDPYEQSDLSRSKPVELKRMTSRLAEELVRHQALFPTSPDGNELSIQIPE